MERPLFFAEEGSVWWSPDARRPIRLQERSVEAMLDIFQEAEAAELFNLLHDAHLAAGGIVRASSLTAKAA